MDSLPYELLQHIAGNLLPRYQCRFAMASRHCYRHLYSHLLRWHVKWTQIRTPLVRNLDNRISIIQYNKKVLYYRFINNVVGYANLTLNGYGFIGKYDGLYDYQVTFIEKSMARHGVGIFDGFYKYMDGYWFTYYVSIRLSPLLSLPTHILYKISCNLPHESRRILQLSHEYLDIINSTLFDQLGY